MEENKRHIDDFLREELGDYTETPPPAVWDALEQRLDAPSAPHKGFNFRRLWWFIPALLFVAGGSYLAAHKWSQPVHVPEQAPTVIDSSSSFENTTGPATNHTDTSFNDSTAPAVNPAQPATQPGAADKHLNTRPATQKDNVQPDGQQNATQPANEVTVPAVKNTIVNHTGTATAKNQVKDQPAARTHKDGHTETAGKHAAAKHTNSNPEQQGNVAEAPNNTEATVSGTPAATDGNGHNQPKATSRVNKAARSKKQTQTTATVANNTTTSATTETGSQPAATARTKKTAKSKKQTQTTATAASNTTTSATTETGSQPAATAQTKKTAKSNKQTQTTAPVTNNAATAGSSETGSQPVATTKTTKTTQKPKTQTSKQTKTAATNATARTETKSKHAVDDDQPARQQQPPVTTPPTQNAAKKGLSVNSAANSKKNNRPGKQQAPETVKNTTPAVDKTAAAKPMVTPQTTARNQSTNTTTTAKNQPAQTAPNSNRSGENGHNRDYTFKSKTATQATTKPKDNLDLSAMQAKAEADTADEKEMDPYASLNPPDDRKKPLHLEGGIKAAYTYGFNDYALNKISVLPYVQLNINTRLSVALHLGFSYGQMKKTDLDGGGSYYRTNPSLQVTSTLDTLGGQLDTLYTYKYKQLRDSFSVKYTTAKSLWEIELPVVLKYNLSSSLSLFGGPVFTFGKVVQVSENKSNTYSRTITDSVSTLNPNQYNIAYFNNKYQPSGTPDSLFSSKPDQNPATNPVRIGYTIGINYTTGRITADLSLQQMLTGPGFIPNETVRKVYTQPYIRLAIGFRIFK